MRAPKVDSGPFTLRPLVKQSWGDLHSDTLDMIQPQSDTPEPPRALRAQFSRILTKVFCMHGKKSAGISNPPRASVKP